MPSNMQAPHGVPRALTQYETQTKVLAETEATRTRSSTTDDTALVLRDDHLFFFIKYRVTTI